MSSSGSGTVINYGSGSGSDFLTSYVSGSGSTSQKVTVPTVPVPVPVPQHCLEIRSGMFIADSGTRIQIFFHPGSSGKKITGSRILIRNTASA
jgi:hypothetical protein